MPILRLTPAKPISPWWIAFFINYADRLAVFSIRKDLLLSDAELSLPGTVFVWTLCMLVTCRLTNLLRRILPGASFYESGDSEHGPQPFGVLIPDLVRLRRADGISVCAGGAGPIAALHPAATPSCAHWPRIRRLTT